MMSREKPPDVEQLVRSMLLLHGAHDDGEAPPRNDGSPTGTWSKAPDFDDDLPRATAVHEATRADRERYLTSGLQPVDCRFCHVTVTVKKLGPGHTAVQWSTDAVQRCAVFTELRAGGQLSSRSRACPKLADSIKHAVSEGCLEEFSTAPSPGDG